MVIRVAVCECDGMLFMVIARLRENDMIPVYQRLRAQGRAIPEGLRYIEGY